MTYWTTMCVHCRFLTVVAQVKTYEPYPTRKDQPSRRELGDAHIVGATLGCGHNASFITTWRQLQPHILSIGARV